MSHFSGANRNANQLYARKLGNKVNERVIWGPKVWEFLALINHKSLKLIVVRAYISET